MPFGGIFDGEFKEERLQEVNRELELPSLWDFPEKAQALGREKVQLEGIVLNIKQMQEQLKDSLELFEMAKFICRYYKRFTKH